MTASAAGLYGFRDHPTYCASKFGCVGLIRTLSLDTSLKNEKITFNAVCPAMVETGMGSAAYYKYVKENMLHLLTPMSTVMNAFNRILSGDSTGEILECSGERMEARPEIERLDNTLEELTSMFDIFLKMFGP